VAQLRAYEDGHTRLLRDMEGVIQKLRGDMAEVKESKSTQLNELKQRVDFVHKEVIAAQQKVSSASEMISAMQDNDVNSPGLGPELISGIEASTRMVKEMEQKIMDLHHRDQSLVSASLGELENQLKLKERQFADDTGLLARDLQSLASKQQAMRQEMSEAMQQSFRQKDVDLRTHLEAVMQANQAAYREMETQLKDVKDRLTQEGRAQRQEVGEAQAEVRELCERLREDLSGSHLDVELAMQEKLNLCEQKLQEAVREAEQSLSERVGAETKQRRASTEALERRLEGEVDASKAFSLEVSQSLELVSSELAKVQQEVTVDRNDFSTVSENERALKEQITSEMEEMKMKFRGEWDKQNLDIAEVARATRLLEERHTVDKQSLVYTCQNLKATLVEFQKSNMETRTIAESVKSETDARETSWENKLLETRGQNEQWKLDLLEKIGPLTRFSENVKGEMENLTRWSSDVHEEVKSLSKFAEVVREELGSFTRFSELLKDEVDNLSKSTDEMRNEVRTNASTSNLLKEEIAGFAVELNLNREEIRSLEKACATDSAMLTVQEDVKALEMSLGEQQAGVNELKELLKFENGTNEALRLQLMNQREEFILQTQALERTLYITKDELMAAIVSKADIREVQTCISVGDNAALELAQLKERVLGGSEESARLRDAEEVSRDQMLVLSRQMRQVHSTVAETTEVLKGDLHRLSVAFNESVAVEQQTRESTMQSFSDQLAAGREELAVCLSENESMFSKLENEAAELSISLKTKADGKEVAARQESIEAKLQTIERNLAYVQTEANGLEDSLSLSNTALQRQEELLSLLHKNVALKADNAEVEAVVSKVDMAIVNICDEIAKLRTKTSKKVDTALMTEAVKTLESQITELHQEMGKLGQLMMKLRETTASSQQLNATKGSLVEVQRTAGELAFKIEEMSKSISSCVASSTKKVESDEVQGIADSLRSDLEELQTDLISQLKSGLLLKADMQIVEGLTSTTERKLSGLEDRVRTLGTDADNNKDIFLTTHQITTDLLIKVEVMSTKLDTTCLKASQKIDSEEVFNIETRLDSLISDLTINFNEMRGNFAKKIAYAEECIMNSDRKLEWLREEMAEKQCKTDKEMLDCAQKTEVRHMQELLGKVESKVVELLTRTSKIKTDTLNKIDTQQVQEVVSRLGGKMAQLSEQMDTMQSSFTKAPSSREFHESVAMLESQFIRLREDTLQDLAKKANAHDANKTMTRAETRDEGVRIATIMDDLAALREHMEATHTDLREAIALDHKDRKQTWLSLVQSVQKMKESHSLEVVERHQMQVESIFQDSRAQFEHLRAKSAELESVCKRLSAELASEVQRREVFGPPLESMLKDKLRIQNTLDLIQAEVSEVKVVNNKLMSEMDRRVEHSALTSLLDHKAPSSKVDRLEDRMRCIEIATRCQTDVQEVYVSTTTTLDRM